LRRKVVKIGFVAVTALWATCAVAQKTVTLAEKEIPHVAVDTLPTARPEFRLVTFADNTFKYIPTDPEAFRSHETYRTHWDTVNLFVYRDIALGDISDSMRMGLVAGEGEYCCPARGRVISKYGPRGRRNHQGTDIKVEQGDPIYSAFDGVVRLSRWNSGGFGNLVIIRHRSGLETYYGHLSRRNVRAGDIVKAGQVIGYGGRTGRASTTHLHFETRYCDQTFDAERIFDPESGDLRRDTFLLRKAYFSIHSRAVEGIEADPDEVAAADSTKVASPQQEPVEPAKQYHKIRSGDTLLALARRYGTTVPEICRLNGITRNTTLRIGKTLRIK
jgi:murein DD-endopeptidase MepM/ murein hydrolase activator NlpD